MKQLLDSASARRKRNAARDGSVGGGGVGAEGPATDDGFAGAFALVPLQVSRVVVAWFWSESEAAGVWRRRCRESGNCHEASEMRPAGARAARLGGGLAAVATTLRGHGGVANQHFDSPWGRFVKVWRYALRVFDGYSVLVEA